MVDGILLFWLLVAAVILTVPVVSLMTVIEQAWKARRRRKSGRRGSPMQ
jgi:heme/copper-type cytochrome/quinol oxidase subunit 2